MSSAEKKIAVVLVVVLVALIGAYFVVGRDQGGVVSAAGPQGGARASLASSGPGSTGGSGGAGEAIVMGPEDAALNIIALVPTERGCHDATIAALRQAYEAHPEDIRLTLVDFFGPRANEWKGKLGVTCATVDINGAWTFDLEGRSVTLQKKEGGTYVPSDLNGVIEAELGKVKS
jgi:hypothetical protein